MPQYEVGVHYEFVYPHSVVAESVEEAEALALGLESDVWTHDCVATGVKYSYLVDAEDV